MASPLKTSLALGASVLLGGAAGLLGRRSEPGNESVANRGILKPETKGAHAIDQPAPGPDKTELQNVSEEADFGGFTLEKQQEVLGRLKAKYGGNYPTNVQLLVARMVSGLSLDQASELLAALPAGKEADEMTRRFLGERIASADAQRVIELGRRLKDETLVALAVSSRAKQDGREALKLLVDLTKSERYSAVRDMTSPVWESHFRGTVSEVGDFVRQNPILREDLVKGNTGLGSLFGKVLAQNAESTGESMEKVRALAVELLGKAKGEQNERQSQEKVDGFLKNVAGNAYRGLVSESAEKGSAFLEGVPDAQKSSWLTRMDAVSRYKTQGLEAAIAFAEKQGGEEFVKMAASGTWVELARKEKESALAWVESLPEGPFRRGAYQGVLDDALRYSEDQRWQKALEAPAALSEKSRVGYYEELIQLSRKFERMGGEPTPEQIVERTLLSDAQKNELYRRVAPIKAQ